jgi:hypothetical protein
VVADKVTTSKKKQFAQAAESVLLAVAAAEGVVGAGAKRGHQRVVPAGITQRTELFNCREAFRLFSAVCFGTALVPSVLRVSVRTALGITSE